MQKRKIIITSSLPYANGDIHLGHLVEYIQTDIWARFQRLRGHSCYYICGIDAHGTPVMLRAQQDGIAPEKLVETMRDRQHKDFKNFHVDFCNFYSTHSTENQQLTNEIFGRLEEKGLIRSRTIKQAYDAEKNMFLPDRFVKGECPRCGNEDQYGDSCDNCGATYAPLDMKNPVSVLSGSTPIEKESEHLFFDLPQLEVFLKSWMSPEHLQSAIINKLNEWFADGLQAWDISRDKPYFGFEIPGHPGKYFYVWLDAPIGYIASFKNYCAAHPEVNFDEFWQKDSNTELYHFVGKDVAYFHSLFWPAVLQGADIRLPNAVYVHGFLTVNGKKMSKSRGTFIRARTYSKHLNPEHLRYYYATKLNDGVEDLDLNLEDFKTKVNSDLVGKVVNIASRCAGFINKKFAGQLAEKIAEPALYSEFQQAQTNIAKHYEQRQYAAAMREIMRLADLANHYINEKAPWVLAKQTDRLEEVQAICSMGINLFRLLIIYLSPVLPELSQKSAEFLNVDNFSWQDLDSPLLSHTVNTFKPLMTRIEQEQLDAMQEDAKQELKPLETTPANPILTEHPIKPEITIDDFMKIDLRVAKVTHADHVEGADKLLRLELDIAGEARQVFAGIKSAYQPEELVGKQVIVVANLKPRKMRFGLSEGMVLATSTGEQLWVVSPDEQAPTGLPIK